MEKPQPVRLVWEVEGKNRQIAVSPDRPVLIGRDKDCDIVLEDPFVSRRHAVVGYMDGKLLVRNLSSTNPVVLNDAPMTGHEDRAPLHAGDVLEVGQVVVKVLPVHSSVVGGPKTAELTIHCPICGATYQGTAAHCPWCGSASSEARFHVETRPNLKRRP